MALKTRYFNLDTRDGQPPLWLLLRDHSDDRIDRVDILPSPNGVLARHTTKAPGGSRQYTTLTIPSGFNYIRAGTGLIRLLRGVPEPRPTQLLT